MPEKKRVLAVASTPYQLFVFLFIKDAFPEGTKTDIVLTDKTPSLEALFNDGLLKPFFDDVLFADGRKIDNPYKNGLVNLWESLVRNKTTDKIVTGDLKTYDDIYFASPGAPDEIVKELSKTLILKNHAVRFHRFEDGFASYTKPSEHIINTSFGRFLYRLFLRYDVAEKEKEILLFCPDLKCVDGALSAKEISRDKDRIARISDIAHKIFPQDVPAPSEDIIFIGQGSGPAMKNVEKYRSFIERLKEYAGDNNFVVKPHPRGIHDHVEGISLFTDDAPFELSLSTGKYEDKTLISFYSTACISGKLLFDSKCRVIFLYPLAEDCFNETNDGTLFFEKVKERFDNVYIAKDWAEVKGLLSLDS